jgi:hypothetical protein
MKKIKDLQKKLDSFQLFYNDKYKANSRFHIRKKETYMKNLDEIEEYVLMVTLMQNNTKLISMCVPIKDVFDMYIYEEYAVKGIEDFIYRSGMLSFVKFPEIDAVKQLSKTPVFTN